ncbi:MAG: M28 family peptidase [Odoribacteraceae bacterium]|nr:M28 family peptidase [Odoribacteraceae bacterium]
MKHLLLILSCCILPVASFAQGSFKKDILFLSSEALGGRAPGGQEDSIARQWIAARFAGAGLSPLPGHASHEQAFEVITRYWYDARLALPGEEAPAFVHHEDFQVIRHGEQDSLSLECVFIGDGVGEILPVVEGKAVIRYSRPLPASLGGRGKRAGMDDLVAAGAKAIIHVHSPGIPISEREFRSPGGGSYPVTTLTLLASNLKYFVDERHARRYDSLLTVPGCLPAAAPAGKRVELVVKRHEERVTTANVTGIKRGTTGRVMIIGAHHDHLGRDKVTGERFPGANDNASGVAMLLELAERYKGVTTACDLVFVAFGCEERGIRGSRYFVENLPVDKEKIAVMINLDMLGDLRDDTLYHAGYHRDFQPFLEKAVGQTGIALQEKDCGLSDQVHFMTRGIPTLFFCTGGQERFKQWHTTGDREELVNYEGMARIARLLDDVIAALDDAER